MVNFPTSLDNLPDPLPSSPTLADGPLGHSALHKAVNDAIEALQTRVGIVGSVDSTSLTYLLGLKASLANPTFTGIPNAPTAAVDTSTNQIASTAYVNNQGYTKIQELAAAEVSPGGAYTVPDPVLYSIIPIFLTSSNLVLTLPSLPTAPKTKSLLLLLRQDGTGGKTVTFPSNVHWPSDSSPIVSSGANRTDLVSFLALGGSSFWFGVAGASNYLGV